jgi:small subunit ribosomal protein S5
MGKAADVSSAMNKGITYAQKRMITVNMKGTTIPHEVKLKLGAARIILKPAPPGSGVIAGGSVRAVIEAAGVKDVIGKILGTSNKISNVRATFEALKQLKNRS